MSASFHETYIGMTNYLFSFVGFQITPRVDLAHLEGHINCDIAEMMRSAHNKVVEAAENVIVFMGNGCNSCQQQMCVQLLPL